MANAEITVTLDLGHSLADFRREIDRLDAWWSSLTLDEQAVRAEQMRAKIDAALADALAAAKRGVRVG